MKTIQKTPLATVLASENSKKEWNAKECKGIPNLEEFKFTAWSKGNNPAETFHRLCQFARSQHITNNLTSGYISKGKKNQEQVSLFTTVQVWKQSNLLSIKRSSKM